MRRPLDLSETFSCDKEARAFHRAFAFFYCLPRVEDRGPPLSERVGGLERIAIRRAALDKTNGTDGVKRQTRNIATGRLR